MTERWETYPLERPDTDVERMILSTFLTEAFGTSWLPVRPASDRLDVLSGATVGQPAALILRPLVVDGESFVGVAIFVQHMDEVVCAALELGGFHIEYAVEVDDVQRTVRSVARLYEGPPVTAPLVRSRRAAVAAMVEDAPDAAGTDLARRAGCNRSLVAAVRAGGSDAA